MTAIHPTPDRGALFRPPEVDVYVAPVAYDPEHPDPQWQERRLLPHWRPEVCRWGRSGRASTLTLRRVLGCGPNKPTRDDADDRTLFTVGSRIELVRSATGEELFRGWIAQDEILIQAGPQAEALTITAYGPELRLAGQAVRGMWFKAPASDDADIAGTLTAANSVRSETFQEYGPVVFNPDGRPNASAGGWRLSTNDTPDQLDPASPTWRSGRVFEPPDRRVTRDDGYVQVALQAAAWTAYEAVRSLVEYLDDYTVVSMRTNWAAVQQLIGGCTLRNVDVTGMDLWTALEAILRPAGCGFYLQPWATEDPDGEMRHALGVYSLTDPAEQRRPKMAARGSAMTGADAQAAEVQRMHFVRDAHNVRNAVVVVGDNKRVEYTFYWRPLAAGASQLRPAWDTTAMWTVDHDVLGKLGDEYLHPFRSFAFNEDGALGCYIADVPSEVADFGLGDDRGSHVRRVRPGGPRIAWDSGQTATHPAKLELLVYDAGGSEVAGTCRAAPLGAWRMRRDRLGVTITKNALTTWQPFQGQPGCGSMSFKDLLLNTLNDTGANRLGLKLTCTVACDERCTGCAERRAGGAWPFASTRVVYDPRRWLWIVPFGEATGHLQRDDRSRAAADAERLRGVCEESVGHGSIVLRGIRRDYAPGIGIPETSGGRVVRLCVDPGGGKAPVVVGVTWNFSGAAHRTELLLETPLLEVTR